MSAICQCSHHRFTHGSYYHSEDQNSKCEYGDCICNEYKTRERNIFAISENEILLVAKVRLAYLKIRLKDDLEKYKGLEKEDEERMRKSPILFRTPTHILCPYCSQSYATYHHILRDHIISDLSKLDNYYAYEEERDIADRAYEDYVENYRILITSEQKAARNNEEVLNNFKISKTCKLFRCLQCWRIIAQDEDVKPFRKGYVHAVCVHTKRKGSGRRKVNVEKLKCGNCNHLKRIHIKERIGRKVIYKCAVMLYDKDLAIEMRMRGENPPSKICSCTKFVTGKKP